MDPQNLTGDWWVQQWLDLINAYRYKKRLERGWQYARSGNVLSIRFENQLVTARVQGTDPDPYRVELWLDPLTDEDWDYVLQSLITRARWSALLLAGQMPEDIEEAFARNGLRLFPFSLTDVHSQCSCPDKANPCKHVSAVYYLLGDRFAEDPFVLFQLRGRSREQLLAGLRQLRQGDAQPQAQPPLAPPDPSRWWHYDAPLDPELVVVTPSLGQSIPERLGDLPLVQDPQLTDSARRLKLQLQEGYAAVAQQAMIEAMQ